MQYAVHFADGHTLNISIIALFPWHKNYLLRQNFARAGKNSTDIFECFSFFLLHICSLGVVVVFIGKIWLLTVGMSEVRRWPIIGILDPIGIYHPDPQLQTNKRCKADRNRYTTPTNYIENFVWFYLRQNCEIGQFFLLALIKDII